MYTSGTTSLPKGVQLTHGALSTFVLESADVADGGDRGATLLSVPLYHVAGLASRCSYPSTAGRRILMMKQFDAADWLRRAGEHRPDARIPRADDAPQAASWRADDAQLADLSPLARRRLRRGARCRCPTVIERALRMRFPGHVDVRRVRMALSETTSTRARCWDRRTISAGPARASRSERVASHPSASR